MSCMHVPMEVTIVASSERQPQSYLKGDRTDEVLQYYCATIYAWMSQV